MYDLGPDICMGTPAAEFSCCGYFGGFLIYVVRECFVDDGATIDLLLFLKLAEPWGLPYGGYICIERRTPGIYVR